MNILDQFTVQFFDKWCRKHIPSQIWLSRQLSYKNEKNDINGRPSLKRRSTSSTYIASDDKKWTKILSGFTFSRKDENKSAFICPSDLIRRGKWSALEKVLDAVEINDNNLEAICCCETCLSSQSLLHLACQYQPPLHTVRDLIKYCCSSGYQVDFYKYQHPLHIALNNNATIEVIMCLLAFNKSAAIIEDMEGKTPLHILFHKYQEDWPLDPLRQVIDKLCEVAPLSLTMIDKHNMKPVDYALLNSFDDHIRKSMQHRTEYANEHNAKTRKLEKLCHGGNKLARFLLAVGNTRNIKILN